MHNDMFVLPYIYVVYFRSSKCWAPWALGAPLLSLALGDLRTDVFMPQVNFAVVTAVVNKRTY
jgi:hypothetical protein